MPGKTGCAPQKLICHFTDRLIQPQLWLTHQEPITVGDGTRSGCKDRVDISLSLSRFLSGMMRL